MTVEEAFRRFKKATIANREMHFKVCAVEQTLKELRDLKDEAAFQKKKALRDLQKAIYDVQGDA